MGVIKDGAISGVLPDSEGFVVHYPGYPSSIPRAVETLGGTEGILKARRSKSNSLELHFRPEDPHSHPAFGVLSPGCNFLLKTSKKKTPGTFINFENPSKCSTTKVANIETVACHSETAEISQEGDLGNVASGGNKSNEAQSEVHRDLFADIVTRVPEAYHFNGMVDYQHVLAVHADVSRKKKRQWADVEPKFERGGLMDLDQEDLMMLVPPLFSPKDEPGDLALKPLTALTSKKKLEAVVQQRWEMEIEPCLAIDFNIEEIPKKFNWEENVQQGSTQWEGLMSVSKLFEEHPIWPRRSLTERLLDDNLKLGYHLLKRLLFKTAYYFSTGPFRRFWIRKGYDPRKDPESRIYQSIDFRLPPSIRNYADANASTEKWRDLCAFRAFPWKSQTALQLCELDDDYIQQEIKKPLERTTCSCSTGWFPSHVISTLRKCVAVRFLSIYPKPGGEYLLKSAKECFEKSKRVHALRKESRPDEEQHANRDSSTKEPSSDTAMGVTELELDFANDNDEPDEDEENYGDGEIEEEEEFEEYASLHLARRSKSNSLELHFRPEDPHSHPAFGELSPCCNFLLKISKKKTPGCKNGGSRKGQGRKSSDGSWSRQRWQYCIK